MRTGRAINRTGGFYKGVYVSVAQNGRARQNGYRSQSQVPEAPKGINRPTAGKLRKAWWRREAGNPDDMLMRRVRVRAPSETFKPI